MEPEGEKTADYLITICFYWFTFNGPAAGSRLTTFPWL